MNDSPWNRKELDTASQLNKQLFVLFTALPDQSAKSVIPQSSHTRAKVLGAQSCPTLCDPIDCSPSGSSVHGILIA